MTIPHEQGRIIVERRVLRLVTDHKWELFEKIFEVLLQLWPGGERWGSFSPGLGQMQGQKSQFSTSVTALNPPKKSPGKASNYSDKTWRTWRRRYSDMILLTACRAKKHITSDKIFWLSLPGGLKKCIKTYLAHCQRGLIKTHKSMVAL